LYLSEIFVVAFWKQYEANNGIWDLLDSFEDAIKVDPRAIGEPHPDHTHNGCWVHQFPLIERLPITSVLYGIDDENRTVTLWSIRVTPH
jgi:hypothetical protein